MFDHPEKVSFSLNRHAVIGGGQVAVGSSLTPVTVIQRSAVAMPPCPSVMVYVRVSVPLKSSLGVHATSPETI